MGFDAGVAFKLEPYPALPVLMAQRDFEPSVAVELAGSYAVAGRGEAQAYPKEVVTFRAEDLQEETLKERLSRFDFKLLVYIPLTTKGHELGFFVLGRREAGLLAPEELSLLDSIGKQVGVALENARLYEQARAGGHDRGAEPPGARAARCRHPNPLFRQPDRRCAAPHLGNAIRRRDCGIWRS